MKQHASTNAGTASITLSISETHHIELQTEILQINL